MTSPSVFPGGRSLGFLFVDSNHQQYPRTAERGVRELVPRVRTEPRSRSIGASSTVAAKAETDRKRSQTASEVSQTVKNVDAPSSTISNGRLLEQVEAFLSQACPGEKTKGGGFTEGDSAKKQADQQQQALAYLQALLQIQLALKEEQEMMSNHASPPPKQQKEGKSAADPSETPRTLLKEYHREFQAMNESCKSLKEERVALKKWHNKVMEEYQELDGSLQTILNQVEEMQAKQQIDANANWVLVHFVVSAVRLLVEASTHRQNVDKLLAELSRLFDAHSVSLQNSSLASWCARLRDMLALEGEGAETRRLQLAGAEAAASASAAPRLGQAHPAESNAKPQHAASRQQETPGSLRKGDSPSVKKAEDGKKEKNAQLSWGGPLAAERPAAQTSSRRRSDMPGRSSQTTRLELAPIPGRADSDGRLSRSFDHEPALLGSARRRSATALGDGAFSLAAQFAVAARAPAPSEEHKPVVLPDVAGETPRDPLAPEDCSPAFLAVETAAAPGTLESSESIEFGGPSCASCGLFRHWASPEKVDRKDSAFGPEGSAGGFKRVESREARSLREKAKSTAKTASWSPSLESQVQKRDATSQFERDLQTRLEMLLETPQVRPCATKSGIDDTGAGADAGVLRENSFASCDLPASAELSATASFATELLHRANSFSLSVSDVRRVLGEALGLGADGRPAKGVASGVQTLQSWTSLRCLPPTPSPTRIGTTETTLSLLLAHADSSENLKCTTAPRQGSDRSGDSSSVRGEASCASATSGVSRHSEGSAGRQAASTCVDVVPSGIPGFPGWTKCCVAERSFSSESGRTSFESGLFTPKPSRVDDAKSSARENDLHAEGVDLVAVYKAILALERQEEEAKANERGNKATSAQEGGISAEQVKQMVDSLWRQMSSPLAAVKETPKETAKERTQEAVKETPKETPKERTQEAVKAPAKGSRKGSLKESVKKEERGEAHAASNPAPCLAFESFESPVATLGGQEESEETTNASGTPSVSSSRKKISKAPQFFVHPSFVSAASLGSRVDSKKPRSFYVVPGSEKRLGPAFQAPSAVFPHMVPVRESGSVLQRHSAVEGPVLTTVPCGSVAPVALPSSNGSFAVRPAPSYVLPPGVAPPVFAYPLGNVPASLLNAYYSAPSSVPVVFNLMPLGACAAKSEKLCMQRSTSSEVSSDTAYFVSRAKEEATRDEKQPAGETAETDRASSAELLATKQSVDHFFALPPHLQKKEAEPALAPLPGDADDLPSTFTDSSRTREATWCCRGRVCGERRGS
ncbi:hypothetical protein TGME49_229640 [Toxoplasma gondii ME49]|uniref:Uncharacterized protein n=1 Tax=Toxoplasma gondii (strain ATCC 50611 / Me49) TaxID=508771 RepID=S8F075_TOXGM|nr:hypothetical protein TGME49_229640 [Toxoplasma gondii ME49]EPT29081.1 hypothetical protein TGME49_229640 [Toxoplasma gondii ME49]|eukprot:XP_002367898.1 hypothetical protein TGME49_229640 [Toxoplasma gondii ME49]